MAKVSVIIPVYNSDLTVERCVNSVAGQSLRDIEIILVDDGSSDKSPEIIDALAKSDDRIRAFHIKNSGPAAARNLGIDNAKGEYLAFCDDDDYIEPEALSYMYEHIQNADMICCGLIFDYEGKSERRVFCSQKELTPESLCELKSRNLLDTMCNKMYRADFIKKNGIRLPDGQLYEDTAFNFELLLCDPKINICDKCFYHYMQKTTESITRRFNPQKLVLMKSRSTLFFTLEEKLGSNGKFAAMYYIRTVLSCFCDYYIKDCGVDKKTRNKIIKTEIDSCEWKSAVKLSKAQTKTDKIMKFVSDKGAICVRAFCFFSYILKYKMRRLFFVLR